MERSLCLWYVSCLSEMWTSCGVWDYKTCSSRIGLQLCFAPPVSRSLIEVCDQSNTMTCAFGYELVSCVCEGTESLWRQKYMQIWSSYIFSLATRLWMCVRLSLCSVTAFKNMQSIHIANTSIFFSADFSICNHHVKIGIRGDNYV